MASIVLGIGSSHSPMLNSPAEDYRLHAEVDQGKTDWKRSLVDKEGRPATYEELLSRADPGLAELVTDALIRDRVAQCQAGIERLRTTIAAASLDALIVVGDDQREQYFDDNMPAMLVYWGETIRNEELQLSEDSPEYWKRARSQYHEEAGGRDYPVAHALGLCVIETLIDEEFDIAHSRSLPRPRGEGHAFGFVHRRLMVDTDPIPILPVVLNTYFPPNQPRPARCYAMGRAIRKAVERWDADARVGIVASGGLSHFTVDEALDNAVLEACRNKDADALRAIPTRKLNTGNSEIRNWIAVAGAIEHLDMGWQDYVPCYRSPAGTGCGMAFAEWA